MIDWRKKHKFVFSDTTESANYCICGLPEDNPLHTDYKEEETIEFGEVDNNLIFVKSEDNIGFGKPHSTAEIIIEALRPEWVKWHKYCYQDKPLPFDGHPDFWEWLMEKRV